VEEGELLLSGRIIIEVETQTRPLAEVICYIEFGLAVFGGLVVEVRDVQ